MIEKYILLKPNKLKKKETYNDRHMLKHVDAFY